MGSQGFGVVSDDRFDHAAPRELACVASAAIKRAWYRDIMWCVLVR